MLTCYEQTIGQRRTVGGHRTALARQASQAERRTSSGGGSSGIDRHHLCVEVRDSLGAAAPGDGLWQWGDLLAPAPGLAGGRRLGAVAPDLAGSSGSSRRDRLVAGFAGFSECARKKGGDETGPNPTAPRGYPGKPGT